MPDYLQITFKDLPSEKKDIVIALLSDAGFEGFEEQQHSLSAFISREEFDEITFNSLLAGQQLTATKQLVAEKTGMKNGKKISSR